MEREVGELTTEAQSTQRIQIVNLVRRKTLLVEA